MDIHQESLLVSVVMPAYNAESYIEEAINSILNQSYRNFEFIIIDDGSTDRTPEILKSLTPDLRIKLIFNEKNEGNYPARNKACRLAKGKYIAVMDADDVAIPERIATQVKYMEKNLDVLLVGGAYKLIGNNLTIVEPTTWEEIRYVLIKTFCMLHPTILIRKQALEEVGYYRMDSLYAEDYDLVLRLALKGKIVNLPEVLLMRRLHDKQISKAHFMEQDEFSRKVQLRYQHDIGIYYPPSNKDHFLTQLAAYIRSTVSYVKTGGLSHGRIGLILFFYQYAAYSKNEEYHIIADKMLNDILSNLNSDIPVNLSTGLCGIGLAIGYLLHTGFVEGSPDEVLSEIDTMIMKKTDLEMEDWSFESGIIGIIYYVGYRLSTSKMKKEHLFNDHYLDHLLRIVEKLQIHKDWICPCPEVLACCKKSLEGELYIVDWNDFLRRVIIALPTYQALGGWALGMNCGAAGWGISTLLNLDI